MITDAEKTQIANAMSEFEVRLKDPDFDTKEWIASFPVTIQPTLLKKILLRQFLLECRDERQPEQQSKTLRDTNIYTNINLIDSGGMGYVYRARCTKLNRNVALKLIRTHLLNDPKARKRFEEEAKILASLGEHPAIVPIYDFGTLNDQPFISMKLLTEDHESKCLNFEQRVRHYRDSKKNSQLESSGQQFEHLLSAVMNASAAMVLAHKYGILHRDIKPGNLLMPKLSESYLMDFGLGKSQVPLLDADASNTTDAAGTGTFMAPEQATGKTSTEKTDVWGLGGLLAFLLTGQVTNPSRDPRIDFAQGKTPSNLAALDAAIDHPEQLRHLAKRCLQVNPADRPTAQEFLDELIDFRARAQRAVVENIRIHERQRLMRILRPASVGVVVFFAVLIGAGVYNRYQSKFEKQKLQRLASEEIARNERLNAIDRLAFAGNNLEATRQYSDLLKEWPEQSEKFFEIRLKRLRASRFLGDQESFSKELAELTRANVPPSQSNRLKIERAIDLLDQSMFQLVQIPTEPKIAMLENDHRAIELLEQVAMDPTATADERSFAFGMLAGDANDAIKHFREALLIGKDGSYCRPYLMVTFLLAGRLNDAIDTASVMIQLSPREPLPYLYKAVAQSLLRKYDDAKETIASMRNTEIRQQPIEDGIVEFTRKSAEMVRLIDVYLHKISTVTSNFESVEILADFIKDIDKLNFQREPTSTFRIFSVPLSPNPRNALSQLILGIKNMSQNPKMSVESAKLAQPFAAEGLVNLIFAVGRAKLARLQPTRADMLKEFEISKSLIDKAATSQNQLWDTRLIAQVSCAMIRMSMSRQPEFAANKDQLIHEAKEFLLKISRDPNLNGNLAKRTLAILESTQDVKFIEKIRPLINP